MQSCHLNKVPAPVHLRSGKLKVTVSIVGRSRKEIARRVRHCQVFAGSEDQHCLKHKSEKILPILILAALFVIVWLGAKFVTWLASGPSDLINRLVSKESPLNCATWILPESWSPSVEWSKMTPIRGGPMPRIMTRILLGPLALTLLASLLPSQQSPPDLILLNGKIFTSDSADPYVVALEIRGERLVATGTAEKIRSLAGPQTLQQWDRPIRMVCDR